MPPVVTATELRHQEPFPSLKSIHYFRLESFTARMQSILYRKAINRQRFNEAA
jgi:hypothetical protein